MAKSTTKKIAVKEVVPETKTGITAPIEVIEPEKKKETEQEEQEASISESTSKESKDAQPVMVVEESIPSEGLYELSKPAPSHEEKTFEERIFEFIESRAAGRIKLNDFLKSLYKVPKMNEPAEWMQLGSSKYLKMVLDMMVKKGKIYIENDRHLDLGKPYHEGTDMLAKNHSLATVEIFVKK